MPMVSVVIPAWQDASVLARCLESLRHVEYPEWECLIIAGGTDGTYDLARSLTRDWANFRVVEQAPKGKNAALNRGVNASKGQVVVLLDADCRVSRTWLSQLVAPLEQGAAATTGNYSPVHPSWISDYFMLRKIQDYEILRKDSLFGGGSIALTRAVVEALGGFPEDVHTGVDWDLDARLERLGAKKQFVGEASIETELPRTVRQFLANEVRWQRARLVSFWRHREVFLSRPSKAIKNLYIYLLSTTFCVLPIAGALLLPFDRGAGLVVLCLFALLCFWVGAREMSLGPAAYAATGDTKWIGCTLYVPILVFLGLIASFVAILTSGAQPIHFKGPRPVMK